MLNSVLANIEQYTRFPTSRTKQVNRRLAEADLTNVLLYENSLAPLPAYPAAHVSLLRGGQDSVQVGTRRIEQNAETAIRSRGRHDR